MVTRAAYEGKLRNSKKQLRVCSKHFCSRDFIIGGNVKKLKKTAIPKIELPQTDQTYLRFSQVLCESDGNKENVSPEVAEERSEGVFINLEENENQKLKKANVALQEEVAALTNKIDQCKLQVTALQGEVEYLKNENERLKKTVGQKSLFTFETFAKSDRKTLYYTGFQTFQIMQAVFQFLLPSGNMSDLNVHKNSPDTCNSSHSFSLNPELQFLLVVFRLRRGFHLETLGDLFKVSRSTAGKVFLCWINLMYTRLGQLNIWPHRNILIGNAPQEFQEKYENVVGSIDCTEFFIETPSSLVKQSQCYSNYKGSTTLKSLIMTDPNGTIIYMSPLFTGSISDKAIMEQSGFIKIIKRKLEVGELYKGDIILADKGFNVSSLLEDVDIEINIPTFRISGTQFTAEEVQWVRKIAHERIHVERAICRLKKYRILTKKIPVSLLGTIEQIYTVCCCLCIFRNKLRK